MSILEINLNYREVRCSLCEEWTEYRWGVPTFNGDIVSNDFPDELWSQGGGCQAVCESCFNEYACGKIKTYDRYYLHLAGVFINGAGI